MAHGEDKMGRGRERCQMGRNLGLGGKIWAINVPNCARKKLVVSNRVKLISRVGSGLALWVGV